MASTTDHAPGALGRPQGDGAVRSEAPRSTWVSGSARTLTHAALSGCAFGFLLQKGGVAKFDILLGVLLLQNFVVVKVMASAVVVGMLGFHLLERRGLVKAQIVDAAYGSNVLGGLLFGVGFAALAYCPGTDAAAVGQGNYDALVGIGGLLLGSYLFALASRRGELSSWGARGPETLHGKVGVSRGSVVAVLALVMVSGLVLLELYGP